MRVFWRILVFWAATASGLGDVSMVRVLEACVEACKIGCATIASVEARGSIASIEKTKGDAKSAVTEADVEAQRAIVGHLRRRLPDVRIVCEEDDALETEAEAEPVDLEGRFFDRLVPVGDVTVFVDPLDGTRELVEGRLENVRCLVGVAVRGRAAAGVAGSPWGDLVFGLADQILQASVPAKVVCFGDSDEDALSVGRLFAREELGYEALEVGGTAAKFGAVLEGRAALVITHTKTMLWDTCATEALVRAAGGAVTDYFGAPLYYDDRRLRNDLGVVASAKGFEEDHVALTAAFRGSTAALKLIPGLRPSTTPQAVDIARDVDVNRPLTPAWLSSAIGEDVQTYEARESDAVRGAMSDGVRLRLDNGKTLFYKRVCMADLAYQRAKSPEKIRRDVKSYAVEADFLSSDACERLSRHVRVPRAVEVDLRPSEPPLDSRFALLVEDFGDGWSQSGLLDRRQTTAALDALATFHAFFWGAAHGDVPVWDSGTYFQPKLQDPHQLTTIASAWDEHLARFEGALSLEDDEDGSRLASLGRRLQAVAARVGDAAHPFAQNSHPSVPGRTIVHGDPKAANFLFCDEGEAALIDFQWTGFGLAATDLAHFVCAAVDADVIGDDDAWILDLYHATLCDKLRQFGKPDTSVLSRAALTQQYEAAVLDTCRLVFAYQWRRVGASPNALRRNAMSLGRNSYNKNMANARWLVRKCDALL